MSGRKKKKNGFKIKCTKENCFCFVKKTFRRLTVVLEDSDGGAGEPGSQHQRSVIEFIAENQAALQVDRQAGGWKSKKS